MLDLSVGSLALPFGLVLRSFEDEARELIESVMTLSTSLFGVNGQVLIDRGMVSGVDGSCVRQIGHSNDSCH